MAPGSHTVPGQPSQGILPDRVEGVVAWGLPGIAPACGVRASVVLAMTQRFVLFLQMTAEADASGPL